MKKAPSFLRARRRRRGECGDSGEWSGHDWATATSYSFPIEETINAYLPQFSGILQTYWGQNYIHLHSDYFGVAVLMLFGAAFGQLARSTQKSFRTFWLVTGLVALLWAND